MSRTGVEPPSVRRSSYHGPAKGAPNLRRGVAALGIVLATAACLPPRLAQGAGESGTACPDPWPIDPVQAAAYLEEAERIGREDGGGLWGMPLSGPILLVDAASRAAVANVPDAEAKLSPCGGVYLGVLPREQVVANTALEWGGRRWAMLLWPLATDATERRRLFAHELFHRLQPALGLPMADPPSPHLESAEGRTWLRLEWRALARALRASGVEREHAIADALAFRRHRHALAPGAAAAERALELNEGLAEYTGARLSGLSGPELEEWAAERLATFDRRESLVRSFAYGSGPAYGILLDAAGAGWRGTVSGDSDLGVLLEEAYGVRSAGTPEAESRAVVYGIRSIVREETERAEALEARRAQLKARFLDGPRLVLPMAGDVSFSFDPGRASTIEGVGTVYETAEVSAAWGRLVVERGGALFLQRDGGFTGIVVPAPADAEAPTLRGEGWRLDLGPGWRIEPGSRADEWIAVRTGS